MIKFIIFSFSGRLQQNESFIDRAKPNFENVSFDVVQKQLVIEAELPSHVLLVSQWFDQGAVKALMGYEIYYF